MKAEEIDEFEKKYGYKPTGDPRRGRRARASTSTRTTRSTSSPCSRSTRSSRRPASAARQGRSRPGAQLGLTGDWAEQADQPLRPQLRLRAPTATSRSTRSPRATTRTPSRSSRARRRSCRASPRTASASATAASATRPPACKPLPLAAKAGEPYVDDESENVYSGKYPLARFLYVYVNTAPGKPLDPLVARVPAVTSLSQRGPGDRGQGRLPADPRQDRRRGAGEARTELGPRHPDRTSVGRCPRPAPRDARARRAARRAIGRAAPRAARLAAPTAGALGGRRRRLAIIASILGILVFILARGRCRSYAGRGVESTVGARVAGAGAVAALIASTSTAARRRASRPTGVVRVVRLADGKVVAERPLVGVAADAPARRRPASVAPGGTRRSSAANRRRPRARRSRVDWFAVGVRRRRRSARSSRRDPRRAGRLELDPERRPLGVFAGAARRGRQRVAAAARPTDGARRGPARSRPRTRSPARRARDASTARSPPLPAASPRCSIDRDQAQPLRRHRRRASCSGGASARATPAAPQVVLGRRRPRSPR